MGAGKKIPQLLRELAKAFDEVLAQEAPKPVTQSIERRSVPQQPSELAMAKARKLARRHGLGV